MDDVLATGTDDEEHLRNVENVFQRFMKYRLRLKSEKCYFMQESVIYMVRRISAKVIQPTDDKLGGRDSQIPSSTECNWASFVVRNGKFQSADRSQPVHYDSSVERVAW